MPDPPALPDSEAVASLAIHRQVAAGRSSEIDQVAVEEPLEIRIGGKSFVTLMRTPGEDRDLVTGLLFTEGLIRSREDISDIAPCPRPQAGGAGKILNVTLARPLPADFSELRRHLLATSSCGVCSKPSLSSLQHHFLPIRSRLRVAPEILHSLPTRLRAAQATFACTGGLHASACFDSQGKLLLLREDVGRHNALDKLIGSQIRNQDQNSGRILLVSGRVAYEIVQKALAAQFPVIAGISAPTSLAVEFAEANNQTLIGFLRDERMNIYTHPQRVGSN